MTTENEKFLDQITDAGMSLADLRAYKQDRALGDTTTPAEWMHDKNLPDTEREKAKNTRISEANNKAGLDQYIDDKFEMPGKDHPEPHNSPASQFKRINSKL
jgi:hypothetical protein